MQTHFTVWTKFNIGWILIHFCLFQYCNLDYFVGKFNIVWILIQFCLFQQCNLDYFVGKFSVGVSLHACGSATDMVLHQCLASSAAFVICPCCYGSIQRTHLLSYPQSQMYQKKNVTYTVSQLFHLIVHFRACVILFLITDCIMVMIGLFDKTLVVLLRLVYLIKLSNN